MEYDPIKDRLGAVFSRHPLLQRLFFGILGAVFLRNWYVRRALKRFFATRKDQAVVHVLDAGTGFGQYCYHIARRYPNAQVHAVDVKEDYLRDVRSFMEKTPYSDRVTFAEADLTQFDSEQKFDLVLSVDVMEHIEDDRAVFRNFSAAMNPGAGLVLNTPHDPEGKEVLQEGEEFKIGEHVREGYMRDDLVEKLTTAGIEVTDVTFGYGTFGAMGWWLLVRIPIRALNLSWLFAVLLPFWYLIAFPLGIILNALDMATENSTGTGLTVVGRRK